MSQMEEGRAKRVATLKKLIIVFLVLGILLPIVLCILLFIKVEQLQRQVNELSAQCVAPEIQVNEIVVSPVAGENETAEQILTLESKIEPMQKAETEATEMAGEEGTKVYLTFDDGPSSHTD